MQAKVRFPAKPSCAVHAVGVPGHAFWSVNFCQLPFKRPFMNSIVYIVGLVVIVIAVLSFFGLR
jgi:hypothetical protein